jgi:hypothetical protein
MNEPDSILGVQRRAAQQQHVGAICRHIFLCCDQTTLTTSIGRRAPSLGLGA